MIKTLFFIEKLSGGGAEKVLCDLVNHMDRTKYEITVQTIWKEDPQSRLEPWIRYRYCYANQNSINRYRYRLETALGLTYRLYIKDSYDLECAFLESGPTKILSGSSNQKAVRLAWVHRDLAARDNDPRAFEAKCAPWYERFDQVVCVSDKVKESFDQIFHHRFHTTVVHNVVNSAQILARSLEPPAVQVPLDRPVLLAVGTLYPPKNYPRLLRSVKRLKEEGNSFSLWILGDGEQRQMLEDCVRENEMTEYVRFLGFQNNPYPYFRLADMLVCASNFEGFSTAVTEALILGKPVVTTDCAGMDELLGESEYGMITENCDEAFLRGVRLMITDPSLRAHYREMAEIRAKQLKKETHVSNTERFLEQMLRDREGKGASE